MAVQQCVSADSKTENNLIIKQLMDDISAMIKRIRRKTMKSLLICACIVSVYGLIFAEDDPNARYCTAPKGLNVRKDPAVSATVIKTLKFGDRLLVIDTKAETVVIGGDNGRWAHVSVQTPVVKNGSLQGVDTVEGWAFDAYLGKYSPVKIGVSRNAVIGRWRDDEYGSYGMDFNDDGTFAEVVDDAGKSGRWEITDKTTLRLWGKYVAHDDSPNGQDRELPFEYKIRILELTENHLNFVKVMKGEEGPVWKLHNSAFSVPY